MSQNSANASNTPGANHPDEALTPDLEALTALGDFPAQDAVRDRRVLSAMEVALANKRAAQTAAQGGLAGTAGGAGLTAGAPAAGRARATSRPRWIHRPWFGVLVASAASLFIGLGLGLWLMQSGGIQSLGHQKHEGAQTLADVPAPLDRTQALRSPPLGPPAAPHTATPEAIPGSAPFQPAGSRLVHTDAADLPPPPPPSSAHILDADNEARGTAEDLAKKAGGRNKSVAPSGPGTLDEVPSLHADKLLQRGQAEQTPPATPAAAPALVVDAPTVDQTDDDPKRPQGQAAAGAHGTLNIQDLKDAYASVVPPLAYREPHLERQTPASAAAPAAQDNGVAHAQVTDEEYMKYQREHGLSGAQPGTQPAAQPANTTPSTPALKPVQPVQTTPPAAPLPLTVPAPVQGPVKPADLEVQPKPATWRRSGLVPNTARLMVGDTAELPLTGMQANIHVDGFRARVLVDLYFYNDRAQPLQGNFNLRLPDGASPYYFAFGETAFQVVNGRAAKEPVLFERAKAMNISYRPEQIVADRRDSWNQPKEARMVPREKAARAFRETVYTRKVDPALLEWSGAGVFAAHVFPLGAQKLHRIVIGYDVDLSRKDDGLTYRFDLPAGVPMVAIDLSVATLRDEVGGHLQVTPAAKPFGVNDYAYFRYDNPEGEAITVRLDPAWAKTLPALLAPTVPGDETKVAPAAAPAAAIAARACGAVLLTGTEAQDDGGGHYFAAQFVPALPALPASGGVAPNAVFLLDTSYSLTPDKFNTYRNLLARILDANREAGLKRFKVLFFDIATHAWQADWADNTPANVSLLMRSIDQTVLEGASDLAQALSVAGFDSEAQYRATDPTDRTDFFLLSDGATTWGAADLSQPLVVPGVHLPRSRDINSLYAYLVGNQGNDRVAVEAVARQTGGAVFTVNGDDEIATAAVAHRNQAWEVCGISMAGVSDLLIVGNPRSLYPNQPVTVVGRGLPAEGASFALKLRMGQDEQTLQVPVAHRIVSELAPRVYGQAAVDRLERSLAGEEAFATAYACHFRVTGQTCSLLMLESEADYARFNIQPEKFNFDVQSTPISSLLARHTSTTSGWTGSAVLAGAEAAKPTAQQAFIAWMGRLQAMPGIQFRPSPAFMTALSAMPAARFQILEEALNGDRRARSQLDRDYLTTLAKGTPTTADLWPEVQRCRRSGDRAGALIAASTRVELSPGDAPTLREAAYLALDLGFNGHACNLLKRVAEQRPFEADTYLTLAQALAEGGNADLALAYYEIALSAQWDRRFGDYAEIVRICYLDFLDRVATGQYAVAVPDYAAARRQDLVGNREHPCMDLVTTVQWNTDASDVDLHVVEPNGEDCGYQHAMTRSGGRISHDVTTGFGPEMYVVAHAPSGNFKIYVHYFAQDRTRVSGATSAYVTVIRKFGSAKPEIFHKVVLLETNKESHDLAVVNFE